MPLSIKIIHGTLDMISILLLLSVFIKKNLWKTILRNGVELLKKILGIIVLLIMVSVLFNIISDTTLLFLSNSGEYVYLSSFILDRVLTTILAYFCFLIYQLSDF